MWCSVQAELAQQRAVAAAMEERASATAREAAALRAQLAIAQAAPPQLPTTAAEEVADAAQPNGHTENGVTAADEQVTVLHSNCDPTLLTLIFEPDPLDTVVRLRLEAHVAPLAPEDRLIGSGLRTLSLTSPPTRTQTCGCLRAGIVRCSVGPTHCGPAASC